MHKPIAFLLAFIITLLIWCIMFTFSIIPPQREEVIISRVIDGDTLQVEDGRIIRLLNINTPEKGMYGSKQAEDFLNSFVNRSVSVQITGTDKYHRFLARVYTPQYLNLEIIKKGYASKFLVNEAELDSFSREESHAIASSRGIWQKSPYFGCIKTHTDHKKEVIKIVSNCGYLNITKWIIKDESRKVYYFKTFLSNDILLHTSVGKDNSTDLFWNSKTSIWNNDRDTLYLFDEQGRVVSYEVYGY